MKITSIKCLVLDKQFPFVFVETDEGITGIGECFRRQPSITKIVIDDLLAPSIIGKDPTNTDARFSDMTKAGNALEIGGAMSVSYTHLTLPTSDLV